MIKFNLVLVMKNAKHIREVRLKLTLFEVALATGMEPSRVSKFETTPGRQMAYEGMKQLAQFYAARLGEDITIDDLLAEAPTAPAQEQPAAAGAA